MGPPAAVAGASSQTGGGRAIRPGSWLLQMRFHHATASQSYPVGVGPQPVELVHQPVAPFLDPAMIFLQGSIGSLLCGGFALSIRQLHGPCPPFVKMRLPCPSARRCLCGGSRRAIIPNTRIEKCSETT